MDYNGHSIYNRAMIMRIDGKTYRTESSIYDCIYEFVFSGNHFYFNTTKLLSDLETYKLKNTSYSRDYDIDVVRKVIIALEYSIRRLLDFGTENILKNEGELEIYRIGENEYGGQIPNSGCTYHQEILNRNDGTRFDVNITPCRLGNICYQVSNTGINVNKCLSSFSEKDLRMIIRNYRNEYYRHPLQQITAYLDNQTIMMRIAYNHSNIEHVVNEILAISMPPTMMKSANSR